MSLFCIHDLICAQQAKINALCEINDTLAANNEALCDKVDQLVGDPDAECPPCPEPTAIVEEAVTQTAAIKEVTTAIQVKTLAVKTALSRTTVEGKV